MLKGSLQAWRNSTNNKNFDKIEKKLKELYIEEKLKNL